ncbi:MAG: formate dehydrogenase accessory protein FdhE [Paracoccaceae bacterium]
MSDIKPDPSAIGGVAVAPFVLIPDPAAVFATRARRFAFLAESSRLGPYLAFLGKLAEVQARLVADLPDVAAPRRARIEPARAGGMPVLDRSELAASPMMDLALSRLCEAARGIDMPEAARLALEAVMAADPGERRWLLDNVLSDAIPEDSVAPHLFAAAAVQVQMARLAATLTPADPAPVGTGVCPVCGGRPATSLVIGQGELENLRYASCACCATRWNEVRIKCLCCGSTKGISYRSVETHEATVKAEVCSECGSWVKILWQVRNHSLDPIADDVGSLGLDLMMKETGLRRGGFDPFLAGYG